MQPLPNIKQANSFAQERLRELQAEINERRIEALKLYEPNPVQEQVHACTASEVLVIGGNRCLAGEQEIYDPVLDRTMRVDEIDSDFHVLSWDGSAVVVKSACRPFVKGFGGLYEVTLSSGQTLRTTLGHRVFSDEGWISVADALKRQSSLFPLPTTLGTFPSASPQDARHWNQTTQDYLGGYWPDHRPCGGQPRLGAAASQESAPSPDDALGHSRVSSLPDDRADTEECSLTYRLSPRPSTPDGRLQMVAHDAAFSGQHDGKPCWQPCQTLQGDGQSAQRSVPRVRTGDEGDQRPTAPGFSLSASDSPDWRERVYITAVRPLAQGKIWDITVEGTECYFAGGVLHHNSGKSICTFVEDARAATGQDPHGKYPEKDGVLVIIGRNWTHIGLVCVPYLLRAGAFKIIRDEHTRKWRAFNPVRDEARAAEAKPAPPLIPPRMIKSISWVLKSANYCNNIELVNGWRIQFFSAEGEPAQGYAADRIHLDEDVGNDQILPEVQARLADRKGCLCWSAMPHSKSESLLGLSERADREEEAGTENPTIRKFTLRFLDNPHIMADEKAKMMERWAALGEDVLRMRAEGEFITDSVQVYPNFTMSVHGYNREDLPNNVVPPDWTRYATIDPGHAVTAVLFGAVPPDGSMLLIYGELYIRQCNAQIFGERFAEAVRGQGFHQFIIDMRGGRLRDIGGGRQVVEQYMEVLRTHGVRSFTTGSGFMAGCDDVMARTSAARSWMHIRPAGTARLRVLRGSCPNLEREIKRYRKKTHFVNGLAIVSDEPNTRGECHAVQCLEYMVASEPKYVAPRKTDEADTTPQWILDHIARKSRGQSSCVYLGPQSEVSSQAMEASYEWV